MKNNIAYRLIAGICIIVSAASCGNIKNLQYVQGTFDSTRLSQINQVEPLIQKGDLLGITVYSDDPLATAAVTSPTTNIPLSTSAANLGGANTPSSTSLVAGFLVNQEGVVRLYKLGNVHAEGKTKKQLSDTLALLYTQLGLLKNPYVEVRFMNYKVTLVGEVNKPGTYNIPTDRISAFEAIGLAGDITVYGRRDNVLVVREVNGKREFGHLDFSKPDVFLSPYYYLQQNDLVIVDVGKNKGAVNNQNTYQAIAIGTSIISIIAIFVSFFRR